MCSWRGHVLPGAVVLPYEARHVVLARETVDGRRLVLCLRCRDWVVAPAPEATTGVAVDRVEELPRPRRGRALREAIVVRFIAVDRALHTVAFASVAVAALVLRWNLDAFRGWANGVVNALDSAKNGNGGASTHGFIAALLTRLGHIQAHSLLVLAMFAGIYAIVSGVEAVGLWLEQRWAEYLTVLTTAGFLPLEIHELLERVTFVRLGAFAVNIVILVYLVLTKHLFGIRGRREPYRTEPLDPLPELVPVRANPDR